MQTIGKKIKELRVAKGLTQENLYPDNPSQISQIESGKIKSPTKPTLNIISKVLDIELKDLVDETDWTPGNTKNISTQYVYSTTEAIVEVTESGEIVYRLKSYPKSNEQGEENIYCPNSGTKLLACCNHCSRSIESGDIAYCMGCGSEINSYTIYLYEIINNQFWHDKEANLSETVLVKEAIDSCKADINKSYNYYNISEELSEGGNPSNVPEETDNEFLDNFMNNNELWRSDAMWEGFNETYFNWESFRFKHKSPNRAIREVWCQHYLQLSYYNGILGELKRYEMNILHDVSQHKTSKKVKKSKQEDK